MFEKASRYLVPVIVTIDGLDMNEDAVYLLADKSESQAWMFIYSSIDPVNARHL